ncbi:hypothetical protein MBLNU230_g1821t1 [Neophaeotheca triangularis]
MVALTEDIEMQEEVYNEHEDEDFNPHAAAADEDVSSSSGDEDTPVESKPAKKPTKRKVENLDDEELDSGDEVTIKERKRKKRKAADGEDSGGEGGLIKTRAQRLAEKTERKEQKRATKGEVTIDVDTIWKELNSVPIGQPPRAEKGPGSGETDESDNKENENNYITITRRIEYAGEVTEIEERVLRSSKEAQRHVREQQQAAATDARAGPSHDAIRRPLRRPSRFEPNPTGAVRGLPPEKQRLRAPSRQDVLMAEHRAEEERKRKAEKMTTVQKSALDWKGFVSEQGLGEELDVYGKSKGGYLEREGFLGRAAGRREEEARSARMRG